ncbi:DUF4466 family protein [Chitinophaga qingshengii]|uniref:DUF4466 family protein n=1 Tax=Chitinophaga qingshengii TaxID=1569794 RepID=A0ABR7TSV3_9BACT|nr:DUF4466 family protein [Chitinophaga qingshengii]MBC9933093.1 DUF4466 family protein [Chitinophaga qingshengii]
MTGKYFSYISLLGAALSLMTACSKDGDYTIPTPKNELQNDCIKRSLGPNIVGINIEFAYAMAIPAAKGKLVSAQVVASIPGVQVNPGDKPNSATYLQDSSFYTNGSGVDVPIKVGDRSVTKDGANVVTFTKDTNAVTLRYFYRIPEEARGKTVSFTFSATSSNGETVTYKSGPYTIAKMDMALNLLPTNNNKCYLSVADMKLYTAAEAAANPDKIDLVYLYRNLAVQFGHALVAPAASKDYLPGVTLPANVNRDTKLSKAWNVQDFHLAGLKYGTTFVDDVDFEQRDMSTSPDFALGLKEEAGVWVETGDGQYRAYIFVNKLDNTAQSARISIKRYKVK